MTSEYKPNDDELDRCAKELEEITGHVRYIRHKLDDLSTRLQDSYEVLREILDATSKENGLSWHDLYDNPEDDF